MGIIVDEMSLQEADAQAVMDHFLNGLPLPFEIVERVRARSERKTDELRRKVGTVEVAVDLIREGRDEA